MRKKNISFIISSLGSGGAERVLTELANNLCEEYNVTIINLYSCVPYYHLDKRIKTDYCIQDYRENLSLLQKLHLHYTFLTKIRSKLKNYKTDVVIGFMTTANIYAAIASWSIKIPCIISERSNPYVYVLNTLNTFLRKFSYPKANYLIVQTNYIKHYYKSIFPNLDVKVIQNPISNELVSKKLDNPHKSNMILNVGRLDANKAQDVLIRAFANINNLDWKLVFVGDGLKEEDYRTLVKSLNMESNIEFVGNSKQVHDFYNSAKIFAFTSRSEGFPNALLEAMHFQLPCISTDCLTGPSELITNKDNGILIPVDDQEQLEHELEILMKSPNLQTYYGKNASISVAKYRSEVISQQWKDLIKKVSN